MASSGVGGAAVVGGAVGAGVVGAGVVAGPVAVGAVDAVDSVAASVVVVEGVESGGVAEPLSSLHEPAMNRAINATPGATRRARAGLTPATIPAAAA